MKRIAFIIANQVGLFVAFNNDIDVGRNPEIQPAQVDTTIKEPDAKLERRSPDRQSPRREHCSPDIGGRGARRSSGSAELRPGPGFHHTPQGGLRATASVRYVLHRNARGPTPHETRDAQNEA